MKTQNVHLLLGALLFASLCGAPRASRKQQVNTQLKTSARLVEDKMPRACGVMSNSRKQKSKTSKSKLRKGKTAKDVAAAKIQAVVRGQQTRKKLMKSDASSTSASSGGASPKISTPSAVSKKAQKAALTIQKAVRNRQSKKAVNDAPAVDPTETAGIVVGS